jgi:3-deoxy-D-manno-octulosonic-acid transferase
MSLAPLAWRAGATLLAPLLPLHLARRARRGKEIATRLGERRGEGAARPDGRLFWLHAASVGELVSILPVLAAMGRRDPDLHVLVTTGTVTSAELFASRLPPELAGRALHRFAPLDVPGWVARFLDGWRPDAGAFVDSELWPNLLAAAADRRIPLALVNARMSARSAARRRWAPGLARAALAAFRVVLARSEEDGARFAAFGARVPPALGDLKAAAPPLPADAAELARLRAAIGGRPVLLAASTHPGEEAMAAAAHRELARSLPGLLTILAPRHPQRGAEVAEAVAAAGLAGARRSAGALPERGLDVYVADTLGELGLFYRLAGVALIGGSLVPHGGQNPLEAARLGCPVVFGPNMWNFPEPVARLLAAGGAVQVAGPAALAPALRDVLSHPDRARSLAAAAASAADLNADLPERVAEALLGLLPPAGSPEASPKGERAGPGTNEV